MRRTQTGPAAAAPLGRGWLTGATAAAALAVITWMGYGRQTIRAPELFLGRKNDYYSSLVHGFLAGHVYMDKVADPGLASPDPRVRASAPAPLDSSYYRGHFYLYFGVTPAAAVLLPYAWLTGSDLDPRLIVILGTAAGFLFALGIWRMAAADHFAALGAPFQVASIACLAFATATPLLLARAMFYEVAIAAGYACVMAGCFWIYRARSGRGRPWLQLACASLSLGLAVGCRPDLVLTLPALAAVAFLAARGGGAGVPGSRALARCGLAAVLPAAAVGAGLAAYNFERFGSPLDFGFKYGMNSFMANHLRLASPAFLWPNIHWYYLTLPAIGPYFPFVFPSQAEFGPAGYQSGETIHGQFPVFALAAFVALSAIVAGRRVSLGRLAAFLAVLGYLFLAVLAALCVLGIRADRYMVDFQPPLVLGAVLLAAAVASRLGRGILSRLWGFGFGALAFLAVAFNFFAGLEEFDAFKNLRPAVFARMEAVGNYPSSWLQRMGLLRYGPVELRVIFPGDVARPTSEPLLTLGTPELNDTLYVNRYPGNQVEFMGDHIRYPEPRSELIPINLGRPYTIKVDMGAFYPPLGHPFFSRYSATQARMMKSVIHVELDDRTVLDARMASYNAPPWTLEIGHNDISMSPARMDFSGSIVSARRLPPPAARAFSDNRGLWRIRCVFPMDKPSRNFPLLSSGVTGKGTLVFVNVASAGAIRFGVDEWSVGGGTSDAFEVAPQTEHTIEIFIGTLAERASWPKDWNISPAQLGRSERRLAVWLDGRLAFSHRLRLPFDPVASIVDVGSNLPGFTSSDPDYPDSLRSVPFSAAEARDFLGRNLRAIP